jgi:hypothetical protein
MLKSGVAVIPMPMDWDEVKVLFPIKFDPESFTGEPAWEPFHPLAVSFVNELSKALLKDPTVREFPDVAAFAFFCRKANMIRLKENLEKESLFRLGRGLVFHITPSNVPVNFAYSLVAGLLSGNVNIVRVPTKEFEQIRIISNAIRKLSDCPEFTDFSKRISLIRYDRQSQATSALSALCDVRVIWGGDETITEIRKSPLRPRAFDVTFADRYSFCLINADQFVEEKHPLEVAAKFYNDTYYFDQNACTSPHLVIWTGEDDSVDVSRKIFWDNLHDVVIRKQYALQPLWAIDKLSAFYTQAIQSDGIRRLVSPDNLLWQVELKDLSADIDRFRSVAGYFAEYHAKSLAEIAPIIHSRYQTLAYYGFSKSELSAFMETFKPKGIDRIVPIGQTADFSLIWDGYDLIRTLSRICEIR